MPRKRHFQQPVKPCSTAHPSLSSSRNTTSTKSHGESEVRSVNDLISLSRQDQTRRTPDDARKLSALATAKTVHPSLRPFLDVANVPSPRPRPGSQTRIQRMASPAVNPFIANGEEARHDPSLLANGGPKSHGTLPIRQGDRQSQARLPGGINVSPGSLLDMTLKRISTNWKWQSHYNQHYLIDLPSSLKELLLDYISRHGPETGLGEQGFEIFFPNLRDSLDTASSNLMTRLDLTLSIGKSPQYLPMKRLSSHRAAGISNFSSQIESWEHTSCSPIPGADLTPNYFENITHLSLAQPEGRVQWQDLLALDTILAPLTHLSLAHWPSPDPSSVYYTCPWGISEIGADIQARMTPESPIASAILYRLSKRTYCLRWLDLTGCASWLSYLHCDEGGCHSPDWSGAWRRLEEVVVKDGLAISQGTVEELRRSKDSAYIPPAQGDASTSEGWRAIHRRFSSQWYHAYKIDKIQMALNTRFVNELESRKPVRFTSDFPDHYSIWDAAMTSFYHGHFFPKICRELFSLHILILGQSITTLDRKSLQSVNFDRLLPDLSHYPSTSTDSLVTRCHVEDCYELLNKFWTSQYGKLTPSQLDTLYWVSPSAWPSFTMPTYRSLRYNS